jgi:GT2 family glycosyltransferase
VGFARAANAGVAAAPPGEILLLNDDTVLDPGCLAALAAAFSAMGDMERAGESLAGP